MPKVVIIAVILLISLFILIMLIMYLYQERLIFFPEKLTPAYQFEFTGKFEEIEYRTEKGIVIHGIHFKAASPKGVVLYFHGNAGSLQSWGQVANDFIDKGYDMIITDYRGYGKSSGKISNEKMLHYDAEHIYKEVSKKYDEQNIIVYGRSLGSGIASKLAAHHNPGLVILETPFYNFPDVVKFHYSVLPVSMILKYEFLTDKYIRKIKCPVMLIHGTKDELIPYDSSKRLAELSDKIQLITIEGGNHNNLPEYDEYHEALKKVLQEKVMQEEERK